jgi:hypothetical protein
MTGFSHNRTYRSPFIWYDSTTHLSFTCYFDLNSLRMKIRNFFHFYFPRATQDIFTKKKIKLVLFSITRAYFLKGKKVYLVFNLSNALRNSVLDLFDREQSLRSYYLHFADWFSGLSFQFYFLWCWRALKWGIHKYIFYHFFCIA